MTPRVAVIGCGAWGRNLVRNFAALDALAAVVDVSEAGRAVARQLAPHAAIHARADAVLADPDLAGIVIATPAETHAELAEQALAARKDVLCEKPLALRYDDAFRLHELAAREHRILMAGHTLEYHPAIVTLQSLVADGQLGDLRYIYSNRLNLGRVRREENILWSFAPHDIAVILRLVGAMPVQVSATGGAYVQPHIADTTVSQLAFENGIAAHVFVSWLNPFKEQKLVLIGSKRMATFDDVRRELVLHDQHVELQDGEPVPIKGAGSAVAYAADEPLRIECRAFLDAIATRRPPITDSASALRVLRVLQAAQQSLGARGAPVPL